jgi:predicted MFS family arabinose efflux permease
VFALLVVWGMVWGGLPLGLQTWMATATPSGAEAGLAMFVTTLQVALAVGSTIGGVAVSLAGIAPDFALAAAIALAGTVVLVSIGLRSSRGNVAIAQR